MALIRCDFYSEALGHRTSMTVIVPQPASPPLDAVVAAGSTPVLYLLHGHTDDDTAWLRQTSIERYVEPLRLAVVMPHVHRSFYFDEAHGGAYFTFLADELPALVASFFNVSVRPDDTFVAGLSMGGYGALKWALRRPGRFAAAACLSGAVDMRLRAPGGSKEFEPRMMARLYGDGPLLPADDLHELVAQADPGVIPPLYICCGTEDHLYSENVAFVDTARARGLNVTVDFGPGAHDWAYWDVTVQDVLAWLARRQHPRPHL